MNCMSFRNWLTLFSQNKIWGFLPCTFGGLTLILTSCKFYLIRISWVPYMTLTPTAHADSSLPSERQFHHSPKINYSNVFRYRSGYIQRREYLKTDSESLFPDSSGHIFNFCWAPSRASTRLESVDTDPKGFATAVSAQDGARQKLKRCPELSGKKFLNLF